MIADVLVVGAGSAGCVVAERLSRNADRRVVVLEAGPEVTGGDVHRLDRMLLGSVAAPSRYARWYRADPPVVRGRAVGGSSVVNGGYFLRAHRDDFAEWGGPFTMDAITAAYDELDGGVPGGAPAGRMSVGPVRDDEVGPLVRRLEERWAAAPPGPWPGVGIQRVPVNRCDGQRWSAADAYLAPAGDRPNLTVRADCSVSRLVVESGRVVGVVLSGGEQVRAGEVVVCAGGLGSAALLMRSGVVDGSLPAFEHREILVRYAPAVRPEPAPVLLPSVAHTADGSEIRWYADDFARFIPGLASSTAVVGVAQMHPPRPGELRWDGERLDVEPAGMRVDEVSAAVAEVVEALSSAELADVVVDGSVAVDPAVGTSQHGWGAMAMGERTDWFGAVDGVAGLRIVDGSILPNVSSGPHATVMMVAIVIADALS
ncbi:putative dehydrogenase [Gordonia araii NBRC 100433]|uniref:Putative dehydrogenase n=1 Tax=Gordonia araii NBRC 100433 TaxID=1073574 RepID=G7GXT4_9ACTN|nr:mycofactocin system GMC family oxidoreductase MftG [Gordonia araii]NNG98395.1 mycofactocin system GMC family oxidoreductase MftG [Gordonia araii NBRC 100433]GAB08409.1 putative dehydrogenase [Gordonia araii NBRC 100433]